MKKRALTLLEIMIVILLITTITGVIGYNMKGALEKGRAFRTERAIEQLKDLLLYRLAEKGNMDEIMKDIQKALTETGLAKDPKALVVDGWGVPLEIAPNRYHTDFIIYSKKLEAYQAKTKPGRSSATKDTEDDDL